MPNKNTIEKENNGKKIFFIFLSILIIALFALRIFAPEKSVRKRPQMVNYTDPGNFYSISYPAEWNVRESTGSLREGIGTPNERKYTLEVISLYSRDRAGITIQAHEFAPNCTDVKNTPNTTFNNFPAYYDELHKKWTVYTDKGMYVIGYSYPGLNNFRNPLMKTVPTPVPSSAMLENQYLIETISGSLLFKDAKPLSC